MLPLIKNALRAGARAFGVRVSKLPPSYIPWGSRFHEVLIRPEPMVIQIDVSRTRWKAGRISFDRRHPFTVGVQRGISAPSPIIGIRQILEEYYRLVQPAQCSEIIEPMGQGGCAVKFSLARHHIPWPWDLRPLSNQPDHTPIYDNDAIVFMSSELHGVQHWGPVSERKLATEARKLADLLDSINRHGYVIDGKKTDSFIRGYIMRKADDWVCVIEQGQHRVSVLSALGYERVPVYIAMVVDYFDLPYFPNLTGGLYSLEHATQLFDSMLAGEPVPALSPWLAEFGSL